MYWNGVVARWVATPHTNIPYTIAKFKKRVYEGNPGVKSYKSDEELPIGTFFMIIPNGKNPIDILNERKKKQV
jgi:hypothetical protein